MELFSLLNILIVAVYKWEYVCCSDLFERPLQPNDSLTEFLGSVKNNKEIIEQKCRLEGSVSCSLASVYQGEDGKQVPDVDENALVFGFTDDAERNKSKIIVTYGTCQSKQGIYALAVNSHQQNARCALLSVEFNFINDILQELRFLKEVVIMLEPDLLELFLRRASQIRTLYKVKFYILGVPENAIQRLSSEYEDLTIMVKVRSAVSHRSLKYFIANFEADLKLENNNATKKNILNMTFWTTDQEESINKINQRRRIRGCSVLLKPFVEEVTGVKTDSLGCSVGHLCSIPVVVKNHISEGESSDGKWRKSCCAGLAIDHFELIKKELGFDYDMYIVEDGQFGSYQNGSWTGIMRELVEDRADIAIQAMGVITDRAKYVKYTTDFLVSTYGIIRGFDDGGDTEHELDWDFSIPLGLSLVIAILVSTLIAMLCIIAFENVGFYFNAMEYFPTREVLTYVLGLAFQRDMGGTNPRNWSGRFVALGYAAAMTVVMSTYTARITASSIKQTTDDNFKGFYDPRFQNPTDDYKFAVTAGRGLIQETYFESHSSQTFRNMHKHMKKHTVESDMEGILRILNGTRQAYIMEALSTFSIHSHLLESNCDKLKIYEGRIGIHGMGYAYNTNFTYGKTISEVIQRLSDNEQFEQSNQKWITQGSTICSGRKAVSKQFDWKYFSGILVVLAFTVVSGIVIVVLENIYSYLRVNKCTRRTTSVMSQNDEESGARKETKLFKASRSLAMQLETGANSLDVGTFERTITDV